MKIPIQIQQRRPGDAETLLAVPTKANTDLEWKASLSLEDMCRDTYNWVRKNPDGYE